MLFTILVTASIISPILSIFYDPQTMEKKGHSKRTLQNSSPGRELSILACLHTPDNVPTLVNLIDFTQPTCKSPISLYPIHLVQLKARASPLVIAHTNKTCEYSELLQPQSETAIIANAFKNYAKHRASLTGGIFTQPYTAMAPFSTMHLEIKTLAEEKKASLIILPFHHSMGPALRTLNNTMLDNAPCSVGIIIDRGLGNYMGRGMYRVAVLFHGGADDREALLFANRMADNIRINLTVLRLIESDVDAKDVQLLERFRLAQEDNMRVAYEEREVSNVEEMIGTVKAVGNTNDLFVVGRGGWDGSLLVEGLQEWSEYPELGIIGDLLASSDYTASVLMMHHYTGSKSLWRDLEEEKEE